MYNVVHQLSILRYSELVGKGLQRGVYINSVAELCNHPLWWRWVWRNALGRGYTATGCDIRPLIQEVRAATLIHEGWWVCNTVMPDTDFNYGLVLFSVDVSALLIKKAGTVMFLRYWRHCLYFPNHVDIFMTSGWWLESSVLFFIRISAICQSWEW